MISRAFLAIVVAAILALTTVMTWRALREHEYGQVTRIAESESYAARVRLVRNVDRMLRALRDVHVYWSTFGHLPRYQWADDSSIELAHLAGIELIAWSEPSRSLRYLRNARHPVLDHRPSEEEWSVYSELLAKAEAIGEEQIQGPFRTSAGRTQFEVYLPPTGRRVDGTLVAIIDADRALDYLIGEDSPGFAITVKARDTVIYQRGEPAVGLPEDWTRSGYIQNSLGTVWEVTHTPTRALSVSMRTSAIDAVLYAGITIAALIGLLVFESGRANIREKAATRAEKELAALNLELEQQIAERTRELEERSRDLVTITDSVGHDLRNPLNAISANAQLLEQQYADALAERGSAILERISNGVFQMTEILDRLLRISTVSSTRFERERLDMKALATDIFQELDNAEPPPAAEFVAEDVPNALAEPVLVETLLMNLFSNALKSTRTKQHRKVVFSSTLVDGLPAYYVRDNGVGFDSELAGRLFRAFERLHRDDGADGLGLGLDIASRVVRRHGGRIWAEGQPGEGATFFFTLGKDSVVG